MLGNSPGTSRVRAWRFAPVLFLLLVLPARGAHAADRAFPDTVAADAGGVIRHHRFPLPGPDKLQHASLSLSLGLGIGIGTRSPSLAIAGAVGLGVAKELRDRRHSRFDLVDLAAGLAGAALAGMLTAQLVR